MLFKRVSVRHNERAIVSRNGRFVSILTPGNHRIVSLPWVSLKIETYHLNDPAFNTSWVNYLLERKRHLVAAHFILVEAKDSEIAMIFINEMLYQVLLPGKVALFWKDAGRISAQVVSIIDSDLPSGTLDKLDGTEEQFALDSLFSEP